MMVADSVVVWGYFAVSEIDTEQCAQISEEYKAGMTDTAFLHAARITTWLRSRRVQVPAWPVCSPNLWS